MSWPLRSLNQHSSLQERVIIIVPVVVAAGDDEHLSGEPVRFALTAAEPTLVRLRIFDAAGRLLAEPMRHAMVWGSQFVVWDRRDVSGAMVAPGNYFYRVNAGSQAWSGRIVVLR